MLCVALWFWGLLRALLILGDNAFLFLFFSFFFGELVFANRSFSVLLVLE